VLPLGRRHRRLIAADIPRSGGRGTGPSTRSGTRDSAMTRSPTAVTLAPRAGHPRQRTRPWGATPAYQTGNAVNAPSRADTRNPQQARTISHAHVTNATPYQLTCPWTL
jgi:hypothetical protein